MSVKLSGLEIRELQTAIELYQTMRPVINRIVAECVESLEMEIRELQTQLDCVRSELDAAR